MAGSSETVLPLAFCYGLLSILMPELYITYNIMLTLNISRFDLTRYCWDAYIIGYFISIISFDRVKYKHIKIPAVIATAGIKE